MNRPLRIICMPGTDDNDSWGSCVSAFVAFHRKERVALPVEITYFSSGECKAVLPESVRDVDLYILSDPYNYSVTYKMRGKLQHCSPADHYAALKSVISACAGKAYRTTVVMPILYGSRQHERKTRESLNAAMTLQELEAMGVKSVITVDLHAPMVSNAVPLLGVDNLHPRREFSDAYTGVLANTVFIAPDPGAMARTLPYAKDAGEVGMFYKRRAVRSDPALGKNKVEDHRWLGPVVTGKNCVIVDDILSSGGTILDTMRQLRALGAASCSAFISFGLFTDGCDAFDQAYEAGDLDTIYVSNLTYVPNEFATKPWLRVVSMSSLLGKFIERLHNGLSVADILGDETREYSKV